MKYQHQIQFSNETTVGLAYYSAGVELLSRQRGNQTDSVFVSRRLDSVRCLYVYKRSALLEVNGWPHTVGKYIFYMGNFASSPLFQHGVQFENVDPRIVLSVYELQQEIREA